MVRIALISGVPIRRGRAQEMLEEYVEKRRLDAKLTYFNRGKDLLSDVWEIGGYDLYICDTELPDMSGIRIAEEMRKEGMKYRIIFINGDGLSAMKAFRVRAFNHLANPLNCREFTEAMDEILAVIKEDDKSSIVEIKIKKGIMRVPVDDISYVDIVDRALCYHFNDGHTEYTALLRQPFRDALSNLTEGEVFCCAGASFAINLSHIYIAGLNYFELRSGEIVTPPKSTCSTVIREWRKYRR